MVDREISITISAQSFNDDPETETEDLEALFAEILGDRGYKNFWVNASNYVHVQ